MRGIATRPPQLILQLRSSPMKLKTMRIAVLAAFLPVFVAGCTGATAAAPQATAVPQAASQAARLPGADFSQLAEQAGPAVVNISVTQKAVAASHDELPFDKSDPMYEFFKRF